MRGVALIAMIEIDKKYALQFLKIHSRILSEKDITAEIYEDYLAVIEYFICNPAKGCISKIVNSYRVDSSPFFEQGLTDVLFKQDQEEVTSCIIKALSSKDVTIQESGAFFASQIPADKFIGSLVNILTQLCDIGKIILLKSAR